MTRFQKVGSAIAFIFMAALFAFLVKIESPSPSLGSGSLYVPVYINAQDAVQATTTVFAFPGVLHTLIVGTPVTNSVITIWDSATSTNPTVKIATITLSSTSTPFDLDFDVNVVNGLTIQQSGATSTLNVTYQQN